MVIGAALLRKAGLGWQFMSEATLEDFVWDNLNSLLGLTPLKRQYNVNGQFCDIIAVDDNKRLVVLELKNSQDRYIIQQLTRYYDALLEVQQVKEIVDYTQPVSLVAITPKIHKDNLIDIKYHTLYFNFMEFQITCNQNKFYFNLKDIDNSNITNIEIPYNYENFDKELPPHPPSLSRILAKCGEAEQQEILNIRSKILRFDERMEEIAGGGSVKYGKGKNKFCAELCLDSQKRPTIFLWIDNFYRAKTRTSRIRFWTEDWKKAHPVGSIAKGLGDGTLVTLAKQMLQRGSGRSLEKLIDMALENWMKRFYGEQDDASL